MTLGNFLSAEVVAELEALIDQRISAALREHREARRWLTVEQAAKYLGLSVSGVRRQIERGRLPVKHLGTRLLIDRHELDRRLERLD